jgi:predicted nucleic acid-binding protein
VPKIHAAQRLIARAAAGSELPHVAVQSLAELHFVLTRKMRLTLAETGTRIAVLREAVRAVATSERVLDAALELASRHPLAIYDAIIVAAAAEAQCDLLLSEDMQDGFTWRGVTIVNPFGPAPDTRLAGLLN